jgi:hypothetical protein
MIDMLVDEFSETLNEVGVTQIINNPELIFRLRQKFNDLKCVKENGRTMVYLGDIVDLDYYQDLINNLKPDNDYSKTWLLLLLKDFISLSRKRGTSIEDEIREFYSNIS